MKSLEAELKDDERKGKYHYMSEYNSETNTKVKTEIGGGRKQCFTCLNYLFNFTMILIVVAVMLMFEEFTYIDIDELTSDFAQP